MVPETPSWEALELPGAELQFCPEFLAPADADLCFDYLQAAIDWQQPLLTIAGKQHQTPRLTAFYGEPGLSYSYSGTRHETVPWPAPLRALAANIGARCGESFNSVLLNCYRDGRDSMGYHSDDEPELGVNPRIASLSLGATRRFLITPKKRYRAEFGIDRARSLPLSHGSLLLMSGCTQHCWQHSVPRQAGIIAARLNLTFRRIHC